MHMKLFAGNAITGLLQIVSGMDAMSCGLLLSFWLDKCMLLLAIDHWNHVDGQTLCSAVCMCVCVRVWPVGVNASRVCQVDMSVFCSGLLYNSLGTCSNAQCNPFYIFWSSVLSASFPWCIKSHSSKIVFQYIHFYICSFTFLFNVMLSLPCHIRISESLSNFGPQDKLRDHNLVTYLVSWLTNRDELCIEFAMFVDCFVQKCFKVYMWML